MLRRGVGAATQPDEKHALVVIARCVAILTPIFGLTWGFGIGTMVSRELGIHVVFALLNSLQVRLILLTTSLFIFKSILYFVRLFKCNNCNANNAIILHSITVTIHYKTSQHILSYIIVSYFLCCY